MNKRKLNADLCENRKIEDGDYFLEPISRLKKLRRGGYNENRINFLEGNDVLKNMQGIDVEYMGNGIYYMALMNGTISLPFSWGEGNEDCLIYFLNPFTNHIECVTLNDSLINLFEAGSLEDMMKGTNYFPVITISTTSNNYYKIENSNVQLLHTSKYRDVSEWDVRSCFPFTGCRLVNTKQEKDTSHNTSSRKICNFDTKIQMFKEGNYSSPEYEFRKNMMMMSDDKKDYCCVVSYIVGPIDKDEHKQFIIVVDDKIFVYDCSNDNAMLINILNEKPNIKAFRFNEGLERTFGEMLFGNYLLELIWDNKKKSFKKETARIVNLTNAPFYGKSLQNNVFV